MMAEKNYESTIMRMAGNIAAGLLTQRGYLSGQAFEGDEAISRAVVKASVKLARMIVEEVTCSPSQPKTTPE